MLNCALVRTGVEKSAILIIIVQPHAYFCRIITRQLGSKQERKQRRSMRLSTRSPQIIRLSIAVDLQEKYA